MKNNKSSIVNSHFEHLYPDTSRFNEIEKIISFIKEGNSVQIVSIPGVGRSNLLGLLAYNTKVRLKHLGVGQKNYHFVNLNLSEVKGKPLSQVFKFIFLELWESLRERKYEYEEVKKIIKESVDLSDEMVIFQDLKRTIEFLALEKNLTIVFLFDRFESFVPTATPEFFSNLRILRNRAKYHFSCVFSLNKPLEEIFEKEFLVDFYEFVAGHIVYLALKDEPGMIFRVRYLEKQIGKKFKKEVVDKVLSLTGWHGKLTRVCLESVLPNNETMRKLNNYLLSQKTVQGVLIEILSALSPSEQKDIKIPLFQKFLSEYKTEHKKEGILFDPKTNEIKKGEVVISDSLTSSEFKLLKFLIENQNKILTREEIISSVWGEMKTTQGVTDEALDQLISRLRKKIEDNPNNPSHLLTIKGRGFKFSS